MDIVEEENEICTQDQNKCINEIVKAILILDRSKKSFKQSDIAAYLTKKPSRKVWNELLGRAKEKLKYMGYLLKDVKNTNSKSFILTSAVFPLLTMHKFAVQSEVADRTLLIIVLSYIFMKEGSVTTVDVFNHLEQLNIFSEQKPVHEYFGDIKKKILSEFISQLYLEKIVDKENDTSEIKWGERAHAEVSKRSILKFVCDIGYEGMIEPKNLASHYHKVLEEEKMLNGELLSEPLTSEN